LTQLLQNRKIRLLTFLAKKKKKEQKSIDEENRVCVLYFSVKSESRGGGARDRN
jgi:hypothetical protein